MRQRQDLTWKVVAAVAGGLAIVLAAWIAFGSTIYQTDRPIFATQTAEQRATEVHQSSQTQAAITEAIQTAEARVAGAQSTADASISLAATQIAELSAAQVQPIATTSAVRPSSKVLTIEQLPASVYAFSGSTDPQNNPVWATSNIHQNEPDGMAYQLDFTLPAQKGAYAGLAFTFNEPQDFSAYQTGEVVLTYGSQSLDGDMIFKDTTGKETRLPIGPAIAQPGEITVQGNGMQQTIAFPLTYFAGINLKYVTEITFLFDSSRNDGQGTLTVDSWLLSTK